MAQTKTESVEAAVVAIGRQEKRRGSKGVYAVQVLAVTVIGQTSGKLQRVEISLYDMAALSPTLVGKTVQITGVKRGKKGLYMSKRDGKITFVNTPTTAEGALTAPASRPGAQTSASRSAPVGAKRSRVEEAGALLDLSIREAGEIARSEGLSKKAVRPMATTLFIFHERHRTNGKNGKDDLAQCVRYVRSSADVQALELPDDEMASLAHSLFINASQGV